MTPVRHHQSAPYHLLSCTCTRCTPPSPADELHHLDRFVYGVLGLGITLVLVELLRLIVPAVLHALGGR